MAFTAAGFNRGAATLECKRLLLCGTTLGEMSLGQAQRCTPLLRKVDSCSDQSRCWRFCNQSQFAIFRELGMQWGSKQTGNPASHRASAANHYGSCCRLSSSDVTPLSLSGELRMPSVNDGDHGRSRVATWRFVSSTTPADMFMLRILINHSNKKMRISPRVI